MNTISLKGQIKSGDILSKHLDVLFEIETIELKLNVVENTKITYVSYNGKEWSREKKISEIKDEKESHIIKIFAKADTTLVGEVDLEIKINFKELKSSFSTTKMPSIGSLDEFSKLLVKQETDFNLFINSNDGLVFEYYRTQATESDDILKEYTRKKFIDKKCINLLTEDNNLPSLEDAEQTEWATEYNTFTVDVSNAYFQSIFGDCIQPRDGDWAILKLTNMPFNISGVIPIRGLDGSVETWRLTMSSYEEDMSIEKDDSDMSEKLDSYEKMFTEEIETEIENATNHKENIPPQIYGDMNRLTISPVVSYGEGKYILGVGTVGELAVLYKPVEKLGSVSAMIVGSQNCQIISCGTFVISILNNKLQIDGKEIDFELEEYAKYFIIVNFFDSYSSVQILNGSKKEIYYDDLLQPKIISGDPKLVFGDLEIGQIFLGKEQVHRNRSQLLFSESLNQKSGHFYIIDKCEQPNNNPRAKENNFRTNL